MAIIGEIRKRSWIAVVIVGVAIVAANNAEEAFNVFHSDVAYKWMLDAIEEDGYYYKKENWVELPMLTANVEHPQIIIEDYEIVGEQKYYF